MVLPFVESHDSEREISRVVPSGYVVDDPVTERGYFSDVESVGSGVVNFKFPKDEKFNGMNFASFKITLFSILAGNNCLKLMLGEEVIPPKSDTKVGKKLRESWKRRHWLASYILMSGVRSEDKINMQDLSTVVEKWKWFSERFSKRLTAFVSTYLCEFYGMKWDPSKQTAEQFVDAVTKRRLEIISMGRMVEEIAVAEVIISGVQHVIPGFMANTTITQLKTPDVINALLSKTVWNPNSMVNSSQSIPQENVIASAISNQPMATQSVLYNQSQGFTKNYKKGVCHFCQKPGHYIRNCNVSLRKSRRRNKPTLQLFDLMINGVQLRGTRIRIRIRMVMLLEFLLEIVQELCLLIPASLNAHLNQTMETRRQKNSENFENENKNFVTFILDTGTLTHVCSNPHAFISMERNVNTLTWFDQAFSAKAQVGQICLIGNHATTNLPIELKLTSCYFKTDSGLNVLSLTKLCRDFGFHGVYSQDMKKCVLYNSKASLCFKLVDGLYQATFKIQHQHHFAPVLYTSQTVMDPASKLLLWHYRFSHSNFDAIRSTAMNRTVNGMHLSKSVLNSQPQCLSCVIGKMKRMSYNTHPDRKSVAFDKIYADVAFVQYPSLPNYQMFLDVVDEATRYVWIYFLENKGQATFYVGKFINSIQTEFGKRVKQIATDQGTEFDNSEMQQLCSKGVQHIMTHPYSPEEHCVVEKMNFVLLNKVRAVLQASGLPFDLWAECLSYVVFTNNRTPSRAIGMETPYEKLYSKKPDVSELLPWGCLVYAFVSKEYRSCKLSPRAMPSLFMGYSDRTKGYRLLSLSNAKMFDMRPQNCFVAEAFTVKGSYVQTLIDRIYKGSADLLPDRLLFVRYPVLCLPTTNPSDCGMLIDSPLATDSYHDFTDVEVKELIGFAEEDAECEEDDDSITGLSCVVQNEPQNALVDSANCVCSLQTKQCLFSSGASSFSTSHPYVPSFSTPLDTIPRGVLESIGRNANEIVSVEVNEVGSLLHPIEMDVTRVSVLQIVSSCNAFSFYGIFGQNKRLSSSVTFECKDV